MPSFNKSGGSRLPNQSEALKKAVIIAIFSAVAVVLGFVEAMLPVQTILPIPGAKLGLANVMILACLYFLNGRDALMLVVLKTLLMTLMLGTFSAFLFSFLGSLFSFIVMYAILKIGRDSVSLIGISVVGGAAHNAGQLTAAYIVFGTANIFYYLPALLITGVVTGIFIGIAVKYIVAALEKLPLFDTWTPQVDASAADGKRRTLSVEQEPVQAAQPHQAVPAPAHTQQSASHPSLDSSATHDLNPGDAIVMKDVHFQYGSKQKLFKGISLHIPHGQWVSIVGPNGSGKSTLIKLLNGLFMPHAGHIYVNGLHLDDSSVGEIRRRVGFLFQNPDNQFFATTVKDDIAFGMENRCVSREEMERQIAEVAAEFRVDQWLERHPAELSGGQKQRVAIAGIMVLRPDIIIFDEATSMLDERSKRELTAQLQQMHASNRYTIISVTHDAEEILASDRAIVLKEGQIAADMRPSELFHKKELMRECRLQPPFTLALSQALQARGIGVADTNDERELVKSLWPLCEQNG
ncbi:energy-coupling factor transporter ATPase [Paenibacillus sp. MER TA 81-3]|uniref:energy-coupling factor transporter ATPase n=1 Tax=Paenibacillus sp. MER TA 81-3 TaxID=2939573 RepID=UPI00203A7CC3|nr:energy-coupling factor transporter ATPase [Paenibacillus sp. MER TA 81-3]MCM3338584.1 energy-coupling factor transporter ATPase [Paenibacillus sp. MER TA 81-3]